MKLSSCFSLLSDHSSVPHVAQCLKTFISGKLSRFLKIFIVEKFIPSYFFKQTYAYLPMCIYIQIYIIYSYKYICRHIDTDLDIDKMEIFLLLIFQNSRDYTMMKGFYFIDITIFERTDFVWEFKQLNCNESHP